MLPKGRPNEDEERSDLIVADIGNALVVGVSQFVFHLEGGSKWREESSGRRVDSFQPVFIKA